MSPSFVLPAPLRDRLIELARAAGSREACALLGGPPAGGVATRLVPIPNVIGVPGYTALSAGLALGDDPAAEFLMDPRETIRTLAAFRSEGLREVAIFHSHPRGPAAPSPVDVRLAWYPHCLYLVCSLADRDRPTLRGFRIAGGRTVEVQLIAAAALPDARAGSVSAPVARLGTEPGAPRC